MREFLTRESGHRAGFDNSELAFSVVVQRSPTPLLLFEARVEPRPTTGFGTLNLARRCRREIAADSDTNVRGKVNQRAVSNTVESLSYKDLSNSP
jgi:hypothetical protein